MVLHTCQGSFKIQGSGFRVLGFGLCQDMRFRVQDLAMGFGPCCDMGGCQNYGPFLGPYYRCRNI